MFTISCTLASTMTTEQACCCRVRLTHMTTGEPGTELANQHEQMNQQLNLTEVNRCTDKVDKASTAMHDTVPMFMIQCSNLDYGLWQKTRYKVQGKGSFRMLSSCKRNLDPELLLDTYKAHVMQPTSIYFPLLSLHCIPFFSCSFPYLSFFRFFHLTSSHSISFHPFQFVSFRFISFHFVSFHFVSFRFISFRFMSFHSIPFHFHFISFHFIFFHFHFISFSFHFVPFHFIAFPFFEESCTKQTSADLPNDFVQHMVHILFSLVHARLGTRLGLGI